MTVVASNDNDSFPVLKTAVISPCGTYRYELRRRWNDDEPLLPFVMLNPSTADATLDDPTIRRCVGFARREKMGGIVVVNLFAFRATEPDKLKTAAHPYGPENGAHLAAVALEAAARDVPVVCAWGAWPRATATANRVVGVLHEHGARLVCLGKTAAGRPRHPLYVRADEPLVPL